MGGEGGERGRREGKDLKSQGKSSRRLWTITMCIVFTRDAHGYPDNKYIRIINFRLIIHQHGGSLFSCTFCVVF